jgi:multidrug efflux pump subunit AcrA (membrane-fusion protein)
MLSGSLSQPLVRVAVVLAVGGFSAFAVLRPVLAEPTKETDPTVEVGNTKPADQKPRELRFKNPGLIKSVEVREGDVIKVGQVLMIQDDTEEFAELAVLQEDATDIRIRAAERSADAKKAEFNRIEKIHREAGNEAEFEKAKAEYELAVLNIEQEKQDLRVKNKKVEKQKGIIDRMKLRSPMDGIVQSVEVHPGEMGEPNRPHITLVNNNPLIVEVNLPVTVSLGLKIDQSMRVSYDKKEWKDAKVSYLAPMANAGAGRQKVHLELSNPEGKVSGLQVFVELPSQVAAQ